MVKSEQNSNVRGGLAPGQNSVGPKPGRTCPVLQGSPRFIGEEEVPSASVKVKG